MESSFRPRAAYLEYLYVFEYQDQEMPLFDAYCTIDQILLGTFLSSCCCNDYGFMCQAGHTAIESTLKSSQR